MNTKRKWIDPGSSHRATGMTMTRNYYLLEMVMFANILAFYVYFSSPTTFTIHNLVLFLPCMALVWASDAFVYQLYLTYGVNHTRYYEGIQVPVPPKED